MRRVGKERLFIKRFSFMWRVGKERLLVERFHLFHCAYVLIYRVGSYWLQTEWEDGGRRRERRRTR